MDKLELGFKQAIGEIVMGPITPIVIAALTEGSQLPGWAILGFGLALAVLNVIFLVSMTSWGVLYTLGWIVGSLILLQSGALGVSGVFLYIVVPAICLVSRAVALFRS